MEIHIAYKLLDVDGTEMGGFEVHDYLVLWGSPELGKVVKMKVTALNASLK